MARNHQGDCRLTMQGDKHFFKPRTQCFLQYLELSGTYHHQLSYHSKLLKGFHSSPGRSSTPRFCWRFRCSGCACRNEQDCLDGNRSLLKKTVHIQCKMNKFMFSYDVEFLPSLMRMTLKIRLLINSQRTEIKL